MAAIGCITFLASGLNKATVVIEPFFVGASLSLRQTHRIDLEVKVPLLVIGSGVLMLVAHLPAIPPPPWLQRSATPVASGD
jgi:hypothetical protein